MFCNLECQTLIRAKTALRPWRIWVNLLIPKQNETHQTYRNWQMTQKDTDMSATLNVAWNHHDITMILHFKMSSYPVILTGMSVYVNISYLFCIPKNCRSGVLILINIVIPSHVDLKYIFLFDALSDPVTMLVFCNERKGGRYSQSRFSF